MTEQDFNNLLNPGPEKQYLMPKEMLIVPLKDIVVFPTMVVTVYIKDTNLIKSIEEAFEKGVMVGLLSQRDSGKPVPPVSNLYEVGTAVSILQVIKGTTGQEAMVLVEGISRFVVNDFMQLEPVVLTKIELAPAADSKDINLAAMSDEIKSLIRVAVHEGKALPQEALINLENITDIDQVADVTCSFLTLDLKKKQELLALTSPAERLGKIIEALNREIELLKLRKKIRSDVSKQMNKTEREFLLRQEMKAIKKQLGDKEDSAFVGMDGMSDEGEIKELKARIKESKMPAEVEKIAMKELDRLKKIVSFSPEFTVARTYIEWLCDMPWDKSCKNKIDVKVARKILDEDHYGLDKIKERILEYLAVCQLNERCGATILCFVGPPGVGKTSLGKSVARALGRMFIHTSLGGVRDEADIRGHRRTYVGAMPGRIVQSIKRAGCNNPVFMLDEIDKLGHDFQGDPASALLEVLDPEQNNIFTDHYLDVPFDLSKTFFILTANFLDPIPSALLDRMEIIELAGYTEEEKLVIAHRYLLPKQMAYNGLEKHPFEMTDEAILKVVRSYTFEAGLRELERELGAICRKIAKETVENKKKVSKIGAADIEYYLGVEKYEYEVKSHEDTVGVATGLAWTPFGGDIIFIEAARMKGSKNLILTGSLGDVMQESARAALSYVRSNAKEFHISDDIFENSDIHIHVPEGATPKDGPSAGITICTALVSLLTQQKIRRDVAMTGEVTLTGRILPIGGLKEKILAAKRARLKTILIPERNKKDLTDIPAHLLSGLTIHTVKTLADVMKYALIPNVKPAKKTAPKLVTKIIQLPQKRVGKVKIIKMSTLR